MFLYQSQMRKSYYGGDPAPCIKQAFFWYDIDYKTYTTKHTEYFMHQVIVSVIPKEGLTGFVPPKPSFSIARIKI